jgi:hypothetical protein
MGEVILSLECVDGSVYSIEAEQHSTGGFEHTLASKARKEKRRQGKEL